MANICIFASGQGSNAKNIIDYFKDTDVNISLVITDKICGATEVAKQNNIKHITISNWESVLETIKNYKIDLIVLAGFLKLVPIEILNQVKVINIHPSLLPKFGGKGMFGLNIHKSVIESGEKQSGITIHWVNSEYDKGQIIAQFSCQIDSLDTAEDLQSKIKQLEIKHFPKVIESLI